MNQGLDITTIISAHSALLAAAKTGLLKHLSTQPQSAQECTAALGLDQRAAECVLEVLAHCGLLIKEGDRYAINARDEWALLLSNELVDSLERLFGHTAHLLRTGEPVDFMDDSAKQREENYVPLVAYLGRLFSTAANELARQLTQLSIHPQRILDVGCGSGVWSLSIASGHPVRQVTGLDFAKVLDNFVARACSLGMDGQVALLPGNMYEVDLPAERFDLAIIANVLRLESPENAQRLVRRVTSAIRPGGWLLVVDALAEGTPEKELQRAIYALNLALRTRIGRVYSARHVREWMRSCGLDNLVELDIGTSVGALGALLGERVEARTIENLG